MSDRTNRLLNTDGTEGKLFQVWFTKRLWVMFDFAVAKRRAAGIRETKAAFCRAAVWSAIQSVLTATEIDRIDTDLRREARKGR